MASNERDWWTKFDMVVKALSALLLPLVILLASQWYTAQQKQADNARLAQQKAADEAQHNTDRVTLLLTHLASENTRQRLLALKFIEYLAQSRQFPEPLLPALISVVDDSDEAVAQAAAETLTQVLNLNPSMTKSVEESAQTNSQARKTLERAVQKSPSLGPLVNVHPAVRDKVPDSVRDSAPRTGKSAPTPVPRPTRRRIENPGTRKLGLSTAVTGTRSAFHFEGGLRKHSGLWLNRYTEMHYRRGPIYASRGYKMVVPPGNFPL